MDEKIFYWYVISLSSDRSELDLSDATIRIQNRHFSRKLWRKDDDIGNGLGKAAPRSVRSADILTWIARAILPSCKLRHLQLHHFQLRRFSQLRICRSPPQFSSGFYGWCAMSWKNKKINFPTFCIFIFELSWKFIENGVIWIQKWAKWP